MTTVGFGDYVPRSTGGDLPAGFKGVYKGYHAIYCFNVYRQNMMI